MTRLYCSIVIAIATPAIVSAQDNTEVLPLPLVSPKSVDPAALPDALTPGEKAERALRNTFGPRAIGNRLLSVGIDQWRGHPAEWGGGMDSFGMRFGSRMGRLAARNSVRLATDVAFKIDPRYDRCECTGFWARTGHAWKRVVVARSDAGNDMPAYSNFTGAYVTPYITYTWYPDRLNTTSRKFNSGTMNLGWRGMTNMLREFWPEVKRGIPFRRDRN